MSTSTLAGPDFADGIASSQLTEGGMLLGHAHGEPVILARRGDEFFAIGASCTHYGAPLADGLLVDDTVRCPWHHACFSLRTGEALRAPALDAVSCWRVELRGGRAYVREKVENPASRRQSAAGAQPESIVIIGGGAAGNAAAEMLRRERYAGRVIVLSADDSLPCDRPNLSKGYLAGSASEESNLLRTRAFYAQHGIDVRLGARVAAIDPAKRVMVSAILFWTFSARCVRCLWSAGCCTGPTDGRMLIDALLSTGHADRTAANHGTGGRRRG